MVTEGKLKGGTRTFHDGYSCGDFADYCSNQVWSVQEPEVPYAEKIYYGLAKENGQIVKTSDNLSSPFKSAVCCGQVLKSLVCCM